LHQLCGGQQPYNADVYAPLHKVDKWFFEKTGSQCDALALFNVFYNFGRIHKTLRCTPAMAAGVTHRLCTIDDTIGMIDARAEAPKRQTVYKIRNSN
jgi:hypothetical protein